jgi:rhodanese-related sulfurtransferase
MRDGYCGFFLAMVLDVGLAYARVVDSGATNLGTLVVGEARRAALAVSNTNDAALHFNRVNTSCECLRVIEWPREIAAGSTAVLRAELHADTPGEFAYVINLLGEPAGAMRSFTITADVTHQARGVSAAQVQTMPAALLLDVRSATSYNAVHIPGAINVPLYAIKARRYWRSRQMVVIDGGAGDPTTAQELRRLAAHGFADVAMLFGGMTAWCAAGGARVGTGRDTTLGEVDPAALLAPARPTAWLVLDMSSTPDECAQLLPGCVRLGPQANDMLAAQMHITAAMVGVRTLTRVAIVDDDGTAAHALQRVIKAPPHCVVFAVHGGLHALRARAAFDAAVVQCSAPGHISPRVTLKRTPCGSCAR